LLQVDVLCLNPVFQAFYFRIGILERFFRRLAFFYLLQEQRICLGQLFSPPGYGYFKGVVCMFQCIFQLCPDRDIDDGGKDIGGVSSMATAML
jgi:hypothetical protein